MQSKKQSSRSVCKAVSISRKTVRSKQCRFSKKRRRIVRFAEQKRVVELQIKSKSRKQSSKSRKEVLVRKAERIAKLQS